MNGASGEASLTLTGLPCSTKLRIFLPGANDGALAFSLDSAGVQSPGFGINCSVRASPSEN